MRLLSCQKTLPPEILTRRAVRSGTSQTMRDICRDREEKRRRSAATDARVLDIGCNDGTLLKGYPAGYTKIGIDPSDVAREVSPDIKVVQDLFPSEELSRVAGGHPFDIITSIAMFYDLEDPVAFVREIKRELAPEGLWVFEMSYMPSMLRTGSYDTICHEHLEYYSLAVIENILKRADMKLVRAQLNDVNGGSIRCYATHLKNYAYESREHREYWSRACPTSSIWSSTPTSRTRVQCG